jgi:YidC/Oxa1 family membrane protein insertase
MAAQGHRRNDPDAIAAQRRRRWLPIVIAAILGLVLTFVITGPGNKKQRKEGIKAPGTAQVDAASDTPELPVNETGTTEDTAAVQSQPDPQPERAAAPPPNGEVAGLRVRLVQPSTAQLPHIGSLTDIEAAHMELSFTATGGGMQDIVFSDIWKNALAKRAAAAHRKGVAAGVVDPPLMPGDDKRYVLAQEQLLPVAGGGLSPFPILGMRSVTINGVEINLNHQQCWSPTAPGAFRAVIEDGDGSMLLEIERRFTLDGWSIQLHQTFNNHSAEALDVSWTQFGPPGLTLDEGAYMDRRRFRIGYLLGQEKDPDRLAGVMSDGALKVEFSEAVDEDATSTLWPNPLAQEEGYELSWFGASSRYFGMVVYPHNAGEGGAGLELGDEIERITRVFDDAGETKQVATVLFSPTRTLAPHGFTVSQMDAFAGPLSRSILEQIEPYNTLRFGGLVLYRMSDFCAFCTFQWLAVFLVEVLTVFDTFVVFDWGLSIILLVLCVRVLLHPVTKRSQMGMQIFSKKMSKLKPEMDKLQKKYKDDKKRYQQEQLKLFREHGVNPLQMLGCLPLFLQTPIWIALWAALYFAFDLRQEAAFYGFFQLFSGWQFLGDLAQPDHCFWRFETPTRFLIFDITGINLLPFLLGAIFYVQQKYMTPKSMSMSPEQQSQQKMMRWMMVLLFPVMLYPAPSGLLLYIITSSAIGILESRSIRKKVDAMDFDMLAPAKSKAVASGNKDAQGRAYKKLVDRREKDARQKKQGPDRHFKKRK